ncbi:VWA domain-containing protein [Caldisphaera lagunensis]|nr:VWA domain-containing protein [Caldisphaera lagunensis]
MSFQNINQSINLETAQKYIPIIVSNLRNKGIKVSVRESILVSKIFESYLLLDSKKSATIDQFEKIMESVIAKNDYEEKLIKMTLEELFFGKEDYRDEIYLAYEKFKNKLIDKNKLVGQQLGDFYKLMAIGGLIKRGKYYRTINKEKIDQIIESMNLDNKTLFKEKLNNILKNLDPEEYIKLLNSDLFYDNLKNLSLNKLIKIADFLNRRHHNKPLNKVKEVIKEKIIDYKGENERLWKTLSSIGILDKDLQKALVIKDPSLSKKSKLDINEFNDLDEKDFYNEKQKVLLNYVKTSENEDTINDFLSKVELKNLWSLNKSPIRGDKGKLISAAIYSSKAYREAMEYAESGNEGRKNMAKYYLQKSNELLQGLDNISLGKINKEETEIFNNNISKILDSLEMGEIQQIKDIDLIMYVDILRSIYRRSNDIVRRKIIIYANKFLAHLIYINGFKPIPIKKKYSIKPGRLMVKESVINMIRNKEDFLIYKRNVKTKQIGLALDISGSMYKYSSWALSVASIFIHNISRLVLFSTKAISYDKISKNDVIKILLTTEFKGYTDITNALEQFNDKKFNKIVIITDLKQTVKNEDPGVKTNELIRKGMKLLFLVPNDVDRDQVNNIRNNGGNVKLVNNPEQLAKELIKLLR